VFNKTKLTEEQLDVWNACTDLQKAFPDVLDGEVEKYLDWWRVYFPMESIQRLKNVKIYRKIRSSAAPLVSHGEQENSKVLPKVFYDDLLMTQLDNLMTRDGVSSNGRYIVVTPVHIGRANFLDMAINSIINQTYKNWELWIFGDSPDAETERVIQKSIKSCPKIYYMRFEDKTPVWLNEVGSRIAISRGEFWSRLASDDTFLPKKMEIDVNFLNEHIEFGACYGGFRRVDEHGKILETDTPEADYVNPDKVIDKLREKFCISWSNICVRTLTLNNILSRYKHLSNESLQNMDDWVFNVKLASIAKIGWTGNEPMAEYRIHSAQSNKDSRVFDSDTKISRMIVTQLIDRLKKVDNEKKKLVYWVAYNTELECEIDYVRRNFDLPFEVRLVDLSDRRVACVLTKTVPITYYRAGDLYLSDFNQSVNAMVDKMFSEKPDLIIWRYPLCLTDDNREYISKNSSGIANVAWCSEQGPMIDVELSASRGFTTIAVNNKMDQKYYENRMDAKIIIMPCGCLPQFHKKVLPVDKYICDIVSDGSPHYHLKDFIPLLPTDKRISCDVVVVPIAKLRYKYRVYGNYEIYHGWMFVPIPKYCYNGLYPILDTPSVYGSAKLYAGITWNHRYGGYGTKLAKAMGCGIPVLWQRTVGMEEDGLFDMKNIIVTESPRETIEKVSWIMENEKERERIAVEGQKYAYEYCDLIKNIQKLLDEAGSGNI